MSSSSTKKPDPPNGRGIISPKHEIVFFSSTAIALYGYDQGMMSLINTNYSYLRSMGIGPKDPLVGIIVSVYYLGCAVGAVMASFWADRKGRKPSIFACLATTAIGNLLMFISGLNFTGGGSSTWNGGALACMLIGRVIMGLGVGGIDAVIPVYSSELSSDGARGRALAQEFQMNIFGLLMAFSINLGVTIALGKESQWAWRIPIVVMQVFPIALLSLIHRLPETPRWFMSMDRKEDARNALNDMHDEDTAKAKYDVLEQAHEEESSESIGYRDMLLPNGSHFHPTMITVMGQVNQALTGYGAVSVYGPQIFELLGFTVRKAEYLTLGNYFSYFITMTLAWMTIEILGRRKLMVWGAGGLATSFILLAIIGSLTNLPSHFSSFIFEIPGCIVLYVATAIFGITWLSTVWLIPTEIYNSSARAQGSAVSVIIWGLANFTVTLLTPLGFNNLDHWLFLVFAATNTFAGWWTATYTPETGGRSFEENQEFFSKAKEEGTWVVRKVDGGRYCEMLKQKGDDEESEPLLGRE